MNVELKEIQDFTWKEIEACKKLIDDADVSGLNEDNSFVD